MTDGKIHHISDTAIWVAMYRAQETQRPDALFKDPFAATLAGERGERIIENIPGSKRLAPFLILRTKVLDDLLMKILDEGAVDAVINLASGLDARPYRLNLNPNLKWFDVDLPEINNFKKDKLKLEKPRCHLEYVPLDLRDEPKRKAFFARVNSESKNIFVITEGFTVYLEPAHVEKLALEMHENPHFEWWLTDFSTSLLFKYVTPALNKTLGENQFKFSMDPGPEMMEAWRWTPVETRYGWQESERLNRKFPGQGFWRLVSYFMPRKKIKKIRTMSGFTLLRRMP